MSLYDTILEDFEDDTTRIRATDAPFDATVAVEDDDDVDTELTEPEISADDEPKSDNDLLAGLEETDTWSDDPVRMYLTQMGEIPLLTRQQEISLAKRIEDTRRCFRTKLLECDYVTQVAYKTLRRVHSGELPFDRTVQVSVTDRLEKEQILGRFPHNLETLDVLLKRNRRDYFTALNRTQPKNKRRHAWVKLSRRRRRTVRMIEELGLRTQRIEALLRPIEDFSTRVNELQKQGAKT